MRATRSRPAPASSTRRSRYAMAREAPDAHPRPARATACRSTATSKAASLVGREAAHSARRIVHVRGDRPGARSWRRWSRPCARRRRIRVLEGYVAEDLITDGAHVTGIAGAPTPTARLVDHSGARGRARDRRHRPSLRRDHQPAARRAGTGLAHRGARRRGDRRSGVRAVPSDRDRHRPRSGAARDRSAARRRRDADQQGRRALHADDPSATPSSRRAISWRAACSPRCRPAAARSSMRARRSAQHSPQRFPTVFASCIARRHRSGARADPGRAGRALPHGRRRDRRARPHLARRPLGRRRSRLDRRARRQPARLELAARGRGLSPRASPRTSAALPASPRRAPPSVAARRARSGRRSGARARVARN